MHHSTGPRGRFLSPTHAPPTPPPRSFFHPVVSAQRREIRSPIATNSRGGRKGTVVSLMCLFAFSRGRACTYFTMWPVKQQQTRLHGSTKHKQVSFHPQPPKLCHSLAAFCARQCAFGTNPARSSPFTRH